MPMPTWLMRSGLAQTDTDARGREVPVKTEAVRAFWLKNILAGAMLCGLLLSVKLWVSTRWYPLSPVWQILPTIVYPLDYACFVLLLALLLAIIGLAWPRPVIIAFVVLAGLYSAWDQTRWQPWFYQYLAMFAALAFFPWRSPEAARPEAACPAASLNACRIIVAFTYFWSGVQKFNASYVADVHPWIIEPLESRLPELVRPWLAGGGWGVSFFEAGIGVGLLVWPLRPVAVCLAVVMHLTLLFALGPLGHNWNTIVWPWNAAMLLMVIVLFWRSRAITVRALIWPGGLNCQAVALVLFAVMPVFSFWDWWDDYLSAALYSGNVPKATIYVTDEILEQLPESVQKRAGWSFHRDLPPNSIALADWAFEELNVPPYPAPRVFCNVARKISALGQQQGEVGLIIELRPPWYTVERTKAIYLPPALVNGSASPVSDGQLVGYNAVK